MRHCFDASGGGFGYHTYVNLFMFTQSLLCSPPNLHSSNPTLHQHHCCCSIAGSLSQPHSHARGVSLSRHLIPATQQSICSDPIPTSTAKRMMRSLLLNCYSPPFHIYYSLAFVAVAGGLMRLETILSRFGSHLPSHWPSKV